MRSYGVTALGLFLCIPVTAQRPAPEEQQRTLGSAREIAVHYVSKLPDFICTEQVERTDTTGPKNLKIDKLTIQLTYFGQREMQKLVTINAKPTTQPLESLDGLITGGEFGSLLLGVFDPSSSAAFEWKQSPTIRKRPAAVYTYQIKRANSHYMVGYRADTGKLNSAAAGYHGEVTLDAATARVLRLTASADDIPKESGILRSSVAVDYDFIDVAGRTYLLPSHSAANMERSYRRIANVVTFTDYHKFAADSTIDFHPPER